MNIKERLQEIEKFLSDADHQDSDYYQHMDFLLSTIKQIQKESEDWKEVAKSKDVIREYDLQRIAELEKEKRKITAAHETFLEETKNAMAWSSFFRKSYDKHFSNIHLAEQVRQAKLSAGVDGE